MDDFTVRGAVIGHCAAEILEVIYHINGDIVITEYYSLRLLGDGRGTKGQELCLVAADPQTKLVVERLQHGNGIVPLGENQSHVIYIFEISDVDLISDLTVANQTGIQMVCYLNTLALSIGVLNSQT